MPSRGLPAVGLQRGKDLPHFVYRLNLARKVCRHDAIVCSIIPFAEMSPMLLESCYRAPSMSEVIGGRSDKDIAESAAAPTKIGFARAVVAPR